MVKLETAHTLDSSLVQSQTLVAVFFGGTSGIGSYTLRALSTASAKNGGKGFRAYIVGRKAQVADEIISNCRQIYPSGQFTFVKTDDVSLIEDCNRICEEITQLEGKHGNDARIDYLMMSQGGSIFLPRKETKEGIDVTMSLMYYSRMRIITKLLPLLLKSTVPATVVSVYATGMEAKLYPEDLSLRDLKHYSYLQARSHMCYMHTLFFESLAEQHPGKLSLIHIFLGLVLGPGFSNPELPCWFLIFWRYIFLPIFARFVVVPQEECGERMLSLASSRYPPLPVDGVKSKEEVLIGTDGKPGSGAYALTWNGESGFSAKPYQTLNKDELRKKVWDHTMHAFEVIEAGKVFTE